MLLRPLGQSIFSNSCLEGAYNLFTWQTDRQQTAAALSRNLRWGTDPHIAQWLCRLFNPERKMVLCHKGFKRCSFHAEAFIYYTQHWTCWRLEWIACCKPLADVHMAGVCGHTWGNQPVLEPAPGHRNHPPPPLWLPDLQRQQPVQHELAGHGSSREAWGWAGSPALHLHS